MDGKSLNVIEEKLNKLKEIIPEAFSENKIDWEKLKAAFGDNIEFKNERYVLNWAGKADAFRVLQSPTTATLAPCKEESVSFGATENIFIEGENLEVLKILQKSYFKIWRSKIDNKEQLVEQLQQHIEPLDENAKTEDVLYELLLKSGIPLTAKIEEKGGCFIVNDNEIALILGKVDKNIIKKVIELAPRKVITLDRLFNKNDQLKTNTALQMKDAGIEFKAV